MSAMQIRTYFGLILGTSTRTSPEEMEGGEREGEEAIIYRAMAAPEPASFSRVSYPECLCQ